MKSNTFNDRITKYANIKYICQVFLETADQNKYLHASMHKDLGTKISEES